MLSPVLLQYHPALDRPWNDMVRIKVYNESVERVDWGSCSIPVLRHSHVVLPDSCEISLDIHQGATSLVDLYILQPIEGVQDVWEIRYYNMHGTELYWAKVSVYDGGVEFQDSLVTRGGINIQGPWIHLAVNIPFVYSVSNGFSSVIGVLTAPEGSVWATTLFTRTDVVGIVQGDDTRVDQPSLCRLHRTERTGVFETPLIKDDVVLTQFKLPTAINQGIVDIRVPVAALRVACGENPVTISGNQTTFEWP